MDAVSVSVDYSVVGEDTETLGEQVRRRREAIGLNKMEFAARAGVNRNWLAQLEKDEANPRPSSINTVLRALDDLEAEMGIDSTGGDPDMVVVTMDAPGPGGKTTKIVVKGRIGSEVATTVADVLRRLGHDT